MPFFDGQTLMFCGSDSPVHSHFANRGTLHKRLPREPQLTERIGPLPAASRVSYRRWKLYYAAWNDRRPQHLNTGLPADAVECSPAFYHESGVAHVSFIGGIPGDRNIVYHLYGMQGPSFDHLSPAAPLVPQATRVGFAAPGYICYMRSGPLEIVDNASGQRRQIAVPLVRVLRASFRADAPNSLIITGVAADGTRKTLVYGLASDKTQEVHASVPVYKSTIVGPRLIVSQSSGSGIEPYQLVSTGYTLADV